MRRRLRERRREREARLLDLGALVYELHRQGKRAPELLQEKAAQLALVDEEVRELEATLDGREAAPDEPDATHYPEEIDESDHPDSDDTQEAEAVQPEGESPQDEHLPDEDQERPE
jgi:hypothetical protein